MKRISIYGFDCGFIIALSFAERAYLGLKRSVVMKMESVEEKVSVLEQCASTVTAVDEKIRVLHVDDDLCLLKIAKQCLETEGSLQIDIAVSVDEALVKLEKEKYDVVVSDYLMPEKDGLDFLKILRSRGNTVPFIMFTGKGREEVAIKALNLGANQYLNKVGETETVYTELAFSIKELVKTRKAEEKLRESEEKFRILAEQCPHMIFINKNGRIVYANKCAEKAMGYTKDEYYSHDFDFLQLIAPESLETIKSNFARHMTGQDVSPFEYKLLTKHGKIMDVTLSSKLIRYQGGPAILGAVVEMTNRRQVEKAIEQSQQRFAALFQGNPEASVYVSPAYTVIDINSRFTSLFGYSADEARGRTLNDLVVPEHLKEEGNLLDKRTTEGFVYHNTMRKRKNGTLVPVSVSSAPIYVQGKLEGYLGVYKDISEQKEAFAKFEGIFMGNPEAAAYLGADFHIENINPRFQEFFGYTLEEVKGKDINEVVVPGDRIDEGKILDNRACKGYVYYDTIRKRKDGSLISVSVSAAPIIVEGVRVGHVAMYKDISELKSAETAMKEMMGKVAIMNEKLMVVGGLTRHDVQNKLTFITGSTYLLKKKLADRPEIVENLKEMEAIVNQIVNIFGFARNYEKLGVEELVYIDVERIIQEAAVLFARLHEIKLVNECKGLSVLADSLLRQLFYNLIDNSLKYGEKLTQIKIHFEERKDSLVLMYEDDGVGIPLEAKSKLFGEGYTTGKGSGHGLYLIKKMMEVYGWTIQEIGEPGRGAVFVMTIPKVGPDARTKYTVA